MPTTAFRQRKTPGVYITELDAFPPSIVGVQTAVPAFIGYTERAEISGKPVFNRAIKVTSMVDFESIFGGGFKDKYDITEVEDADAISIGNYDFKVFDPDEGASGANKYYDLNEPAGAKHFNLYESMRLFFENGGGNCYIVSVGDYENNTVNKDQLSNGLDVIAEQDGPTMLVIPDAVLLPPETPVLPIVSPDFNSIAQQMLAQCDKLQDRVAILDVYGSNWVGLTPQAEGAELVVMDAVIDAFRIGVGDKYLNYGMSYFPFLETTVMSVSEMDYTYVVDTSYPTLKEILSYQNKDLYYDADAAGGDGGARYVAVQADIDAISEDNTAEQVRTINQNLTAMLPVLPDIERIILSKSDQLPTSPAMAGVCTFVDNTKGVWNAPANVALSSVSSPSFKINNEEQGDLNVPVNGKAVNAIREFTGRGTVVWGARTLDGNSNDWRYIQVRRTLIYIEQSIAKALDQFVFAANDGKTWVTVVSMVSNFLQGLWSQGGLMGATASEAFSVECGLGSTMTGQDVLEGYMIVQVTLQMIHPAEFIELTFKQKMEGVA